MIDDATSRLFARFVRHDTGEENRRLLASYLDRFGRPLAFYTDKAGMFQVAVKTKLGEEREGRDRPEMPPTQIARALRELGIVWIPAHSPQAKGRVERQFLTAQDRMVKGMRVAGVSTIEAANVYLEQEFLTWWNETLTVESANADDAHRPLGGEHDLAAILSHVEQRQVTNHYTIPVGRQGLSNRPSRRASGNAQGMGARGATSGRKLGRAIPGPVCGGVPLRSTDARIAGARNSGAKAATTNQQDQTQT